VIYDLNICITGTDIVPTSEIAESFHIAHSVAVIISGKIGKGCFVTAHVGVGGGKADDDVGAGRGLPVIGDDVWLGVGCKVVGPIRVGNRATIGAMSLVLHDVPEGATVCGIPARIMKTEDASSSRPGS
jgi:serine O-acetyltransferase